MLAGTATKKPIVDKVLCEHSELLEEKLNDPCGLARHLLSAGRINQIETEWVEAAGSGARCERARKLVDILSKKDDIALDYVLEYLLNDGGTQLHIFRRLKESAEALGYQWQLMLVQEAEITANQVLPEKWWEEKKTLNHSFFPRAGKDDQPLIKTLYRQLHSSENRTLAIVAQTQSLVGMGGVGKTTTAIWYGNDYEAHYDHVIWIDAEGKTMETSIKSLARALKIPVKHSDNYLKSAKELMKEVNTKLRECECLYIFDNVERYDDVRGFLSTNSSHYTIITSRMLIWGHATEKGRIPTCPLDVFKEDECFQFLKNALLLVPEMGPYTLPRDEDLLELGELLGHLPLALQCAVATIATPGSRYTFEGYLARIRTDVRILTDKKILDEYTRPVGVALTLSLEQIENDALKDKRHRELCRNIMSVASYCDPDEIYEEIFTHLENVKASEVESAIEDLVNYSLVTVSDSKKENGQRRLHIHRLLQHVLKNSLELDPERESDVLRLVLMCFQSDYRKYRAPAISVWKRVLRAKYEKVLREFQLFSVHLAHNLEIWDSLDGVELIKFSLTHLSRLYGDTGLPIFQYSIELAYWFIQREMFDHADSLLQKLKKKLEHLTNDRNALREEILPHIKMVSLTSMCVRDQGARINEIKDYVVKEYSNLLDKIKNSEFNDVIDGYLIRHRLNSFNPYNLSVLSNYDLSPLQLIVTCNYATTLRGTQEATLAIDIVCDYLNSLSWIDIARTADFRQLTKVLAYIQDSTTSEALLKLYTCLKSCKVIMHWMQTDPDDGHDSDVASLINTYFKRLFISKQTKVLASETKYLYQLSGRPEKKIALAKGLLHTFWEAIKKNAEQLPPCTDVFIPIWGCLRPQANSNHGVDKKYLKSLLRLREGYTFELLRNDMHSEVIKLEEELFGYLQKCCDKLHLIEIKRIRLVGLFKTISILETFGRETNAMQEILKLRLRTDTLLLNSLSKD